MQAFDYSLLWGRIKTAKISQVRLANAIGIAPNTLGLKLKGQTPFRQWEISSIAEVLAISPNEIGNYFFTPKVEKTQ